MINSLTSTLQRYSPRFWVLVGSSFIGPLGTTLVFPFFSLYITYTFDVGMTEAAVILDSPNPNLLWYLCGVFCLAAIAMFLSLNQRVERRVSAAAPMTGQMISQAAEG